MVQLARGQVRQFGTLEPSWLGLSEVWDGCLFVFELGGTHRGPAQDPGVDTEIQDSRDDDGADLEANIGT